MHSLSILVELAIALAACGLVSRLLFVVLSGWRGGFANFVAIHGWSFAIAGMLFVVWCSTPEALNWFAAHKVFLPQCFWFAWDCLRMTGQHEPAEAEAADSGDSLAQS